MSNNFEYALQKLKEGHKIYRRGWNGIKRDIKMYVYLVDNADFEGEHGHDYNELEPFFAFYNSEHQTVNVWMPSMWDMMAEDWALWDI